MDHFAIVALIFMNGKKLRSNVRLNIKRHHIAVTKTEPITADVAKEIKDLSPGREMVALSDAEPCFLASPLLSYRASMVLISCPEPDQQPRSLRPHFGIRSPSPGRRSQACISHLEVLQFWLLVC